MCVRACGVFRGKNLREEFPGIEDKFIRGEWRVCLIGDAACQSKT